jgi:hypothetical protein
MEFELGNTSVAWATDAKGYYRKYLDLETLVCTRSRGFPIARVAERLRCPRCGAERYRRCLARRNPQFNAHAVRSPRQYRCLSNE